MKTLVAIHHSFYIWQQKRLSRIVITVLFILTVAISLVPVLSSTYSLHNNRIDIFEILTGPEQVVAAQELHETGFIQIRGNSFGDVRLKNFQVLDKEGLVIDPAGVTSLVLRNSIPRWIPSWLLINPNLIWLLGGLVLAWGAIAIWLGLFPALLYSVVIGSGSWYFFLWIGAPNVSIAVAGMCILGFSYHLFIKLLLLLFRSPTQISTLARGVLYESIRTRLSISFLMLLLVLLPLVPIMLDPASPLRHRIQTLLSRSLGITFGIAAFLTVFLCCATVAFEIRDRQIWQVLTKPVSKFGYLMGKWVGVLSINFAILTVASVSVFFYLQYLRSAPVADGLQGNLDRIAVEEEILTARIESHPIYDSLSEEQLSLRVEMAIDADPDLRDKGQIRIPLRKKLREELQESFLSQQRSIPPKRGDQVYSHTYRFEGLQHAKKMGTPLAFKYRFHITQSDEHDTFEAGLMYNGDPATRHVVTYVPTMTHVTMIPAYLIDDDGVFEISIFNLYQPPPVYEGMGAIVFDTGGIRLLYRVGDFEPNFFRAMLVLWIKLAFLAALALAASTFLSFPVACMVTLTVFICGTLAPYLSVALQAYIPPSTAAVDFGNIGHIIKWTFENAIRGIASAMVYALDGFGEQRPTDQLVNGMLVSWSSVIRGIITIGFIWSGIALSIGTYVLKKRQLAIYSGNG